MKPIQSPTFPDNTPTNPGYAQVPCSKMVGLAKALTADGFETSGPSFVSDLSRVREKNAEERAHDLLSKYNLSLPIPLKGIHGKPEIEGFPRLKPLDLFSYMSEAGHLNKLLGGKSLECSRNLLEDFWNKYRNIHPDFQLFNDKHVSLRNTIPIIAHIDGGRGYKKSEFMVFNFGPVVGCGSGKRNFKDPSVRKSWKKEAKFRMALLRHSYTTHYLYACMPSAWHKSNETAFQSLLEAFAEDLMECYEEGISCGDGEVLRLALIGLKGDLKLQARAGRLTQWFATARKRPYNPDKPTTVTGKCCWLCPAGCPEYPFEEIHTKRPRWLTVMQNDEEPPWTMPGGMIQASLMYMKQPSKFYFPDLFHIYLAGVGQDFGASCLVYMLPLFFQGRNGNSVDKQLEMLNEVFTLWRKMHKVPVNLTAFTRDRLTSPDAKKIYPTGTWPKAADTTRIVQFIRYILELNLEQCDRGHDSTLYYMKRAADSIGDFMKGLYKGDLWLEPCPSCP